MEIIARYGSIGASPYRVDAVSFSLETRHGPWMAQEPIKSKGVSAKKRTSGALTFRHFTEAKGRSWICCRSRTRALRERGRCVSPWS